MYLPREIDKANVLITVKTYPLPSSKYGELVCTAGILEDGKWIRIYPIDSEKYDEKKIPKYSIVELDLVKNESDFRPESYRPKQGIDENIKYVRFLDTKNSWKSRKEYVLKEVYHSMNEIIILSKSDSKKSLATLKPFEIVDFIIKETDRNWKSEWIDNLNQSNMFKKSIQNRRLIPKVPFEYSYKFISKGDSKPRTLLIEDWEIGELFWHCLKTTNGDEKAANNLVKKKYFDEFKYKKDMYFFLGTTLVYHNVAPNPFVIIGTFYPPENKQLSLL